MNPLPKMKITYGKKRKSKKKWIPDSNYTDMKVYLDGFYLGWFTYKHQFTEKEVLTAFLNDAIEYEDSGDLSCKRAYEVLTKTGLYDQLLKRLGFF